MLDKYHFGSEFRRSLATELKRVAWAGSAAVAMAGWQSKVLWTFLAVAGWWVLFQVFAHLLLARKDEDEESADH